eukprot:TRINITY_DN14022_c0_g1_i2.p1 TRINITY_DN14022_c0_g1~~TRINITY_DN14022_c0_g1_i2.p1  ORF type:complete len:202 (-),score=19.91 TRINITY_DN14022_c0_g1_i2:150-755(-)
MESAPSAKAIKPEPLQYYPERPRYRFSWEFGPPFDSYFKLDHSKDQVTCLKSVGPFKSLYGDKILVPGNSYYWEITLVRGAQIKIGVVLDAFREGTVKVDLPKGNLVCFSDTPYGWALYSSGELRHNNNQTGPRYCPPFGVGDIIGVLLDLQVGSLGFFLNGEYYGVAFKDPSFCQKCFYPAAAVLLKGESFLIESNKYED